MTAATLDEVMTEEQLAARWRIAISTLRNWRRQGKVPSPVRLGQGPRARVVYKVADVLSYEEQQKGSR